MTVTTPGSSGIWQRAGRLFHYPNPDDARVLIEKGNPPSPGAAPCEGTVDTLYDVVQRQTDAQQAQVASLESKAVFVLGSASLLTAAATALPRVAMLSAKATRPHTMLVHVAELLTVAVYVVVVACSSLAYSVRRYQTPPDPRVIREYMYDEAVTVKRTFMANMIRAFDDNQVAVKRKVWWTRAALWALLAEALCLALSTLLQTIS